MARPPAQPTLDFFPGFDAAARHRSFTRAADELHLTQSALSRQIKTLENEIGTPLFERAHDGLRLTAAGETLHRVVREVLRDVAQAVATIRAAGEARRLTVSTTIPFASLWLVPRLPHFRERRPGVEVFVSADNAIVDLERGEVDLVVRFTSDARAPEGAVRLFGERIIPVASATLLRRDRAGLKRPQDLSRHVLLHLEDPLSRTPWVDWSMWLASAGARDVVAAGHLRFSQYDQVMQAAIAGQGIALGRRPLIDHLLASGTLAMPFAKRYDVPRSYFAIASPHASTRPDAQAFLEWMVSETSEPKQAGATPRKRRPS